MKLARRHLAWVFSSWACPSWPARGGRAGHAGTRSRQQAVFAYACPMHPQYRSDRPGDCPSCGMRLEPVREEARVTPAAAATGPPSRPARCG